MATKNPRKYNTQQLTKHLRELAAEVHTVLDDGTVQTRGEALAALLWQKALGHTEIKVDDEGKRTEMPYRPEAWAIQLVYDRMEGKSPQAITEKESGRKTLDKVRDLALARLNDLAADTLSKDQTTLRLKGPPKLKNG